MHRWVGTGAFVFLAMTAVLLGCGDSNSNVASSEPPAPTAIADSMTIDRVLRTDDRFSTLVAALDSTGLDSLLAGTGPYTLFAPPNSAFDRLPEGTVEVLMAERRGRLRTILAHHVVDGRRDRAALGATTALRTQSGDTLRIRRDSVLTVGTAVVVEEDVRAANGVIHVLDRVLPPPAQAE